MHQYLCMYLSGTDCVFFLPYCFPLFANWTPLWIPNNTSCMSLPWHETHYYLSSSMTFLILNNSHIRDQHQAKMSWLEIHGIMASVMIKCGQIYWSNNIAECRHLAWIVFKESTRGRFENMLSDVSAANTCMRAFTCMKWAEDTMNDNSIKAGGWYGVFFTQRGCTDVLHFIARLLTSTRLS